MSVFASHSSPVPTPTITWIHRALVLSLALLAAWWLSAHWGPDPMQRVWAVAGAVAIVFVHAWVMLIEYALLLAVRRGDPAAPASLGQLLGAWAVESARCAWVFGWWQPWRWNAVPDDVDPQRHQGRTGVVLVHGFVCNRGLWMPWLRRLRDTGVPVVAVNLEHPFGDIDSYAPIVDAAVQRLRQATGRPPVLVGHSMGGLAMRAWLAADGARGQVRVQQAAHLLTLGTPHHGTWPARFAHARNARQMRQGAWTAEPRVAPEVLAQFECLYTNADAIVMPPSSATLPGARQELVPGVGHLALTYTPQAWAALQRSLAAAAGNQAAAG